MIRSKAAAHAAAPSPPRSPCRPERGRGGSLGVTGGSRGAGRAALSPTTLAALQHAAHARLAPAERRSPSCAKRTAPCGGAHGLAHPRGARAGQGGNHHPTAMLPRAPHHLRCQRRRRCQPCAGCAERVVQAGGGAHLAREEGSLGNTGCGQRRTSAAPRALRACTEAHCAWRKRWRRRAAGGGGHRESCFHNQLQAATAGGAAVRRVPQ